jgi:hypothetical protein
MFLGVGGRHLLETCRCKLSLTDSVISSMTYQVMEDQLNSLGQTSRDEDTRSKGVKGFMLYYYATLMQHVSA